MQKKQLWRVIQKIVHGHWKRVIPYGDDFHLNEYNDRHCQRFSSKNLKEAVLQVMDEEGYEIERNINNITCNTSFQSPVAMNVQKIYKFFIRETTWFRCFCRNGLNFQRMHYPINNQGFCTQQFRQTGWQYKWFRGTGLCKELVKKRFCRTGW